MKGIAKKQVFSATKKSRKPTNIGKLLTCQKKFRICKREPAPKSKTCIKIDYVELQSLVSGTFAK